MFEDNFDFIRINLKRINNEISEFSKNSGRNIGEIKLIAVSKTFGKDEISAAINCGQTEFGESYIQEAIPKIEFFREKSLSWHFIGHLQTNKVKFAINNFSLIHSVDSLKLAKALNNCSEENKKITRILLELNLAEEKSKFGIHYEDISGLMEEIIKFKNIRVMGLMTIPPFSENPENSRKYYRKLKEILNNLKSKFPEIGEELSMGMSNDFKIAIEEGATILRIGSLIFGERIYVRRKE